MATFADLMSLLMTFFVLLLSFSNLEIVKFKTMSGSLREAFGLRSEFDIMNQPMGSNTMPIPSPSYSKDPNNEPSKPDRNRSTLVKLRNALDESELKKSGNVEITERGVTLRLEGDAVFATGKTDLKPGAVKLLDELIAIAKGQPGSIEVEGHTDDVPMKSARFPSNWELSTGRAGVAVRYLTGHGLPASRMKAIGFADTRPLVPNSSPENRSKNRRIEFLFLSEESPSDQGITQP